MYVGYSLIAALVAAVVGLAGGYALGFTHAAEDVTARWNEERVKTMRAVDKARQEVARIEARAEAQIRKQTDEYTQELRRREAAAAGNRRELDRLRHLLAAAAGRSPAAKDSTPGQPPDGAASVAGELLGECAGELAAMGEQASRLASQLIGLQSYVNAIRER
jgi:hypothetical protein